MISGSMASVSTSGNATNNSSAFRRYNRQEPQTSLQVWGSFFISMYGGMYGVFHASPRNACDTKANWRKRWDSNPRRVAPRWFSRPVHSTTLPHFRFWLRFEFYIAGRKKSSLLRSVRTPLKDSTVHHGNIRLVARRVIDLFACRQSWSSRRRVPEATPEA